MSRRRRNFGQPEVRQSIGDGYVQDAVNDLNRRCGSALSVMTEYSFTREQTLPMLFADDVINKMQQVKGMVNPKSDTVNYPIDANLILTIDYEDARLPAIDVSCFHLNRTRVGPLLQYVREVTAIYEKYEEVKAVLRWLNRNATPGAVRYLWPTALQLCPKAPSLKDMHHVPTRFDTPRGINVWTQALKDSATTVVSSLLLPETAKPRPRNKMWLTFTGHTIGDDETTPEYQTDQFVVMM